MKYIVLLTALLAISCDGPNRQPPPKAAAPEAPPEYFHPDPATAATLTGKIVFHGKKPAREAISMESDAACQQAHAGHPVYNEPVVTGKDGGLANAFVYIQSGLEGKTFEPVKDPVVLDQHGCMFVPRVVALRAAQPLEVKNSDPVAHNLHPMPKNNREWNEEQSPGSPDREHKFARFEIIPVKCNVHSWMHAWIAVAENPYYAVTGPDGAFDLRNLPPGDYTVAVWHETLGTQTKQVHVAPSSHAAIDFSYQ